MIAFFAAHWIGWTIIYLVIGFIFASYHMKRSATVLTSGRVATFLFFVFGLVGWLPIFIIGRFVGFIDWLRRPWIGL